MNVRQVLVVWSMAALAGGCGDDAAPGFQGSTAGQIEVTLRGQSLNLGAPPVVLINAGAAAVGGTVTETLVIRNTGSGPLTLGLELDSGSEALSLAAVTVDDAPVAGDGLVIEPKSEGGPDVVVTLAFRRDAGDHSHEGVLWVRSNTQQAAERAVALHVRTDDAFPVAVVEPSLLAFGQVSAGETAERTIQVANTGTETLTIGSMVLQGHPDFRVSWGEAAWEPDSAPVKFDPPLQVAPSEVRELTVQFSPLNAEPAEGSVRLFSNDPVHPSGLLVALTANTEGPRVQVNPARVQFGGKLVGTKAQLPVEVRSVGTADLVVTDVRLAEGSSGSFSLAPLGELPWVVPVNHAITFGVVYVPAAEATLGDDGQPQLDLGTLVIETNTFHGAVEVEVSGMGATIDCPVAVGQILEGEQVVPQTLLHLRGDGSFAPAGAITQWAWTVEQPPGAASVFVPSAASPNPTLAVNVAGEYVFRLNVADEHGEQSCLPWEQRVLVIPDEAIHVELLWHNPWDPDETDIGPEAGADVDLHFAHGIANSGWDLDGDGANDPWFDAIFDCFWFNAHPNWASFDPSVDDDPGLDRDDTDGAGPENLNLNLPEATTYRVGVHYWSAHGYGPSQVTVRVYIYSQLVFEVSDVTLHERDLWEVATIDWPSGVVTLVQGDGGGYRIIPSYNPPSFL